jgi:hypothetical protein
VSIEVHNLRWSGNPRDTEEPDFRDFIAHGLTATPRLIWWLEPSMFGLADLLLTTELADGDPIRVRPGGWVHRSGGLYRRGRMGADGVASETLSRAPRRSS